jgi:hypothetical protein
MTARFQGGVHNAGIIQPTEQAEKQEKENFFKHYRILIAMGDLNAKLGGEHRM